MMQRNFVLYPLAEISPNLKFPCGTPLSDLLANYSCEGLVRIENEGDSSECYV
jgi:2-amino-4-hydroxy-6-hydroxymethyldihydropteridine diphosphokinase